MHLQSSQLQMHAQCAQMWPWVLQQQMFALSTRALMAHLASCTMCESNSNTFISIFLDCRRLAQRPALRPQHRFYDWPVATIKDTKEWNYGWTLTNHMDGKMVDLSTSPRTTLWSPLPVQDVCSPTFTTCNWTSWLLSFMLRKVASHIPSVLTGGMIQWSAFRMLFKTKILSFSLTQMRHLVHKMLDMFSSRTTRAQAAQVSYGIYLRRIVSVSQPPVIDTKGIIKHGYVRQPNKDIVSIMWPSPFHGFLRVPLPERFRSWTWATLVIIQLLVWKCNGISFHRTVHRMDTVPDAMIALLYLTARLQSSYVAMCLWNGKLTLRHRLITAINISSRHYKVTAPNAQLAQKSPSSQRRCGRFERKNFKQVVDFVNSVACRPEKHSWESLPVGNTRR